MTAVRCGQAEALQSRNWSGVSGAKFTDLLEPDIVWTSHRELPIAGQGIGNPTLVHVSLTDCLVSWQASGSAVSTGIHARAVAHPAVLQRTFPYVLERRGDPSRPKSARVVEERSCRKRRHAVAGDPTPRERYPPDPALRRHGRGVGRWCSGASDMLRANRCICCASEDARDGEPPPSRQARARATSRDIASMVKSMPTACRRAGDVHPKLRLSGARRAFILSSGSDMHR